MQYQDVETNSVADLQVAISDDEEAEYFAVDEGPVSDAIRVLPPAVSAAALPGGAVHQPSFPGPSVCDSSAVIRSHMSVVADTRAARGDDARGVEIGAARGVEIDAAHGVEIGAAQANAVARSAYAISTEAITPVRGMSPASEPPGFLSNLSRRFLPSFFSINVKSLPV